MSKIAVVGGAGYVGSFTANALNQAGHEVVVVDNLSSGHKGSVEGLRLEELDILKEEEKLRSLFEEEKFDSVFHFAALIQMGESMENPGLYFRHNVLGSLNVLEAARRSGVSSFVFSSSAGVYGNPQKLPIPEDHPLRPTNPYGETKTMVEKILVWYWKVYGLASVSIRYFNAAGGSLDGKNGEDHPEESHLIPNIINSLLKGEKLTVFGGDYDTPDGTAIRDYIHVIDLADVHIKALEYIKAYPGAEVFNAGTGRGHSNLEVLEMVEQVSGQKVNYEIGPRRRGDATELVADPTRAKELLDWSPAHSDLETVVKTAWLWHSSYPDGY